MLTKERRLPVYWHPIIALHDAAAGHVAMALNRLELISSHLIEQPFADLVQPVQASLEELAAAHDHEHLLQLSQTALLAPGQHFAYDRETRANRHTWPALTHSAGGWLQATRGALISRVPAAFVVSYAGHHAHFDHVHGFCFVNGVVVAARSALKLGAERVAVLDFDTHAGDGTTLSFMDEPRVMFGETYQGGFPGNFMRGPAGPNVIRRKLTRAAEFEPAWEDILSRVQAFRPDVVLVSAGFDAHRDDPLSMIGLDDEAYHWLGQRLAALGIPVVCGLEGGYNLDSTRRASALFCAALVGL